VSGAAAFKGICNGDATSLESFVKPTMRAFNGELVVTVKTVDCAGLCSVVVTSDGLAPACVQVPVGR
jgi:beta-galactosidase